MTVALVFLVFALLLLLSEDEKHLPIDDDWARREWEARHGGRWL